MLNTTLKPLRIAIIGCGYWGPNFVRNFLRLPHVAIAGICDTNSDRRAFIKKTYPALTVCSDYRRLLHKEPIEAAVISTPAGTHFRITEECLIHGLHVLCEKPLSLTAGQIRSLMRLAGRRKRVLMVGHTYLYNAAVKSIREIVRSGELGRIYYIHARRSNLGPLRRDVNAIWDLSPHDISIITHVLGKLPTQVSAYAQRFLSHGVEDVGFAIMRFAPDILAHLHVSWLDPKKVRELTIIGSKKMLVYEDTNTSEPIRIYDKGVMQRYYSRPYRNFREFRLIIREGEVSVPAVTYGEPLFNECEHFLECIRGSRRPLSDGENALSVVKVLNAIDASIARKGAFTTVR